MDGPAYAAGGGRIVCDSEVQMTLFSTELTRRTEIIILNPILRLIGGRASVRFETAEQIIVQQGQNDINNLRAGADHKSERPGVKFSSNVATDDHAEDRADHRQPSFERRWKGRVVRVD